MGKAKNKFFFILAFLMGLVRTLSNYLVKLPVNYFGLSDLLTYGAFSYPVAFLITDLSNRRYGKDTAKKNCIFRICAWNSFNTLFFYKLFRFDFY